MENSTRNTAIADAFAQARAALAHGNEIRVQRARRLAQVRAVPRCDLGTTLGDLIVRPSPELRTLDVERLLRAARGVGKVRARVLLREAGLTSPSGTVASLSSRQRHRLARAVSEYAARAPERAAAAGATA